MGRGWLGNKQVYVETAIGSDYVDLNTLWEAVPNYRKFHSHC